MDIFEIYENSIVTFNRFTVTIIYYLKNVSGQYGMKHPIFCVVVKPNQTIKNSHGATTYPCQKSSKK